MTERDELITKLTDFIREIGLAVYFETVDVDVVLPGLMIREGTLVVDREKLLYPGDLLHEAGHLAVLPTSIRKTMNDRLEANDIQQGGEVMAFSWSYAACLYLDIDPHIVFHENGYQGGGKQIVEGFTKGSTQGVPLMQWYELTYMGARAEELGIKPYPHMAKWVCEMEFQPGTGHTRAILSATDAGFRNLPEGN